MKRAFWKTRYGFYMAAVGAAFGLGNIWRFPYIVGANGGGAFIVLYFFCILLIGLPLLIGELMLGKLTRRSVAAALAQITGYQRSWVWLGHFAVIAAIVVLSYYSVISGWVLYYLFAFAKCFVTGQEFDTALTLKSLMENGWLQLALVGGHLLITVGIVSKGVQEGIEKWLRFTISPFLILLIFLLSQALFLPSSAEAMRFLFYPDFSKLTTSSLGQALGHVFFTLSLGFGIMVAFGSYFREDTHIPTEGFRVALIDTIVSLSAGLLIFTIVFGAGAPTDIGPQILFETLPILFSKIGWGPFLGAAFFLCLYTAALAASFSLLETAVSNLVDRKGLSRSRSAWMNGLLTFAIAIGPALSSSELRNIKVRGLSLLAAFDSALINWALPIVVLGISMAVVHKLDPQKRKTEFAKPGSLNATKLYPHWLFFMKWIVPLSISVALLVQLIGIFT